MVQVRLRGMKHLLIWSIRPIPAGRELLMSYGAARPCCRISFRKERCRIYYS
jgi:hypothetical protein